jgi:hypothetical protein
MSNTNDGGPSFPTSDPNYETKYAGEGMSLRDYFAAKALMGLMASRDPRTPRFIPDDDAMYVYAVADAMLKARGKS